MKRVALVALVAAVSGTGPGAVPAGAQAPDPVADVPVQAGSPWPSMRRDRRNTGASPVVGRFRGNRPWRFRTGKGIFSTPVIGADGTVYVGSADGNFYALDGRTGRERWRHRTGGIIDAAAVIGRRDKRRGTTPITIGSGDEVLYQLRTEPEARRRVLWRFKASRPPATGQLVNWWEGNVALGLDGNLYAGNTGGGAYSLTPDGRQRWVHQSGNSVWTTPAFARDGTTFWGSLDLTIFALDAAGQRKWSTTTIGFVTSSPALSADERTLYVGSFDSKLYALDAATGLARWTFQTRDHIYASPALAENADGSVHTIYIASTDGSVYALDPSGRLRWRYDTGDPVRSSPVVGRDPDGGRIVYVGSSDGRLYALDGETGRRRWSYDTTPTDDPVLRDRNDLNGSPALGRRGVYIAGEHGYVTFVPYDHCRARRDARCSTEPGQPFGDELTRVYPVTAGGGTRPEGFDGPLSPAIVLNARLVVRRNGRTFDAGMLGVPDARSLVDVEPDVPFTAELSPDGQHVFVAPEGFLRPDTEYRVRVAGAYAADGVSVGNTTIGGTQAGSFGDTIRFRTAPLGTARSRLRVGRRAVTGVSLRRLAVPLPPFLTSVNQIGFDSYDLIVGAASVTPPDASGEGRVLLWVIGGRRGKGGVPVADPRAGFAFPLAGRYRGDALLLSQRNLRLTFSFGEVPTRRFDMRMQLDSRLRARNGASLYAEVTCSEVPTYGPVLPIIGLCNPRNTLAVSGTFLTERLHERAVAHRRPAGVKAAAFRLVRPTATAAGEASAELRRRAGARYPARDHSLAVLLVDAATGEPVALDYPKAIRVDRDAAGNATRVRTVIPAGTQLPERVRAYVMADVFPLGVRVLG